HVGAVWIYAVGPAAGSVLAVLLNTVLHPKKTLFRGRRRSNEMNAPITDLLQLSKQLSPAVPFTLRINQRPQAPAPGLQGYIERSNSLRTVQESSESFCVAEGKITRVIDTENAKRAGDVRREHGHRTGNGLGDDIGPTLHPRRQDQ